MPSSAMRDIYRQIKQTAEKIADISKSSIPSVSTPCPSSCCDHNFNLTFDSPAHISSMLIDDGVPSEVSERLSDVFVKKSFKLQTHLQENFQITMAQMTHLSTSITMDSTRALHRQLELCYHALYEQKLSSWTTEVRRMAISKMGSKQKQKAEQVPPVTTFNYNYTPVLEAFFAQEQFPSRKEKQYLAERAGMSYRQIHVWFQNRRSRTRKSTSHTSFVEHYAQSGTDDTDVEDCRDDMADYSSRSSSFTLVADDCPFDTDSPTHAFPKKYPPDFDVITDPFPCRFGDFSSLSKFTWVRTSVTHSTRQREAEVDVDSLTEAFERLRIHSTSIRESIETTKSLMWGSHIPRRLTGYDVMTAYTIRPLSAPIASFIQYPYGDRNLESCTTIPRPQYHNTPELKRNFSSTQAYTDNMHDVLFKCKPEPASSEKKPINKPRLSKRIPTSRPKLSATSVAFPVFHDDNDAKEGRSFVRGRTSSKPSDRTALSTRSVSTSSNESLPSLTFSISSSSSSETHSPSSPAQIIPDEAAFSFSFGNPATPISDASEGFLEDIPFPLFPSSDFSFDILSNKVFADNLCDLTFTGLQADSLTTL